MASGPHRAHRRPAVARSPRPQTAAAAGVSFSQDGTAQQEARFRGLPC